MGFNTSGNSSTSRRTTQAVNLGYLRNRIASTTRKFNYCKEHSANPSLCINQFINIAPQTQSTDGALQVMVDLDGFVFTSNDYGVSFYKFQVSGNPELGLVKTSYDGTHKVAISNTNGYLYLFSNNTWTITPNQFFNIDISSDGKYQTATQGPFIDTVYRSADYGNNWSPATSIPYKVSICLSSSGQQQVIASIAPAYGFGTVYKSNNYGITWTQTNIVTTNSWIYANISGDGSIITAGSFSQGGDGIIQYSLDNGANWSTATVNWSTETPGGNRFAGNICSSYNGQYQAFISRFLLGAPPSFIYVSTDGGVTWNKANVPELIYTSIAISNSGKYISAVAKNNVSSLFYYFRSVNYGQTFEQINYGTVSLTAIDIN